MEQTEESQNTTVSLDNEEQFDDGVSQSLDILENLLEADESVLTEEVKESKTEETTEEVLIDKSEVEEPVVDDALILLYPSLHDLKGKPITDIGKSYDNLLKEYNKVKNQPETDKVEDKTKIENTAKVEEVPYADPYDDPEGFKKWAEANKGKQNNEESIKKLLDDRFQAEKDLVEAEKQQIKDMEAQSLQFQKEVTDSLAKILPKEITPKQAIDFYIDSNKDTLLKDGVIKEDIAELFTKNQDYFVKSVADYVTLARASNKTDADIRSKAYEVTKNGLSKKTTGELSQSTAQRQKFEVSPEDELVQELYHLNSQPD